MSTFGSHFRIHPQRKDESAHAPQRKHSSRIPLKPNGATDSAPSTAAQHVSKLARSASRSVPPTNKTGHATKTTASAPGPVIAAHNHPTTAKRTSVVPPNETAPTGLAQSSMSRRSVLLPPPAIRTPSLFSGSSASSDSPKSNGLRRKPSIIERYTASRRAETPTMEANVATVHRRGDEYKEAFEDSVLGISLPTTGSYEQQPVLSGVPSKTRSAHDIVYGDQRAIRVTTPVIPNYAPSVTPSTRYTDSPFSHAPTPSSTSSYSPALVATSGAIGGTLRPRQQSPTRSSRPPVTQRPSYKGDASRLGLPPVRESSTSSSNSTVKSAIPRKEIASKPSSAPSIKSSDSTHPVSRGKLVKQQPKRTPSSSIARKPVQIPPELAHLNVDQPPPKSNLQKPLPPIRPSRDGTPVLSGMRDPSPVVQSDLPLLYTTYHKRTPSQEIHTPVSTTSPSRKSRFTLSKTSSKQASPRIDSAVSPPPAAHTFVRGATSDNAASEGHRLTRKDSPAVSTGPSPSKSPRFGFFSRKPKVDGSKAPERPKRQPVKGPAAGTGHEGYGRFGVHGRSGSTASSGGYRSPSGDSTTSVQPTKLPGSRKSSFGSRNSKDSVEMDDFLRERLKPAVVRGSGGSITSNTPSSSDTQGRGIADSNVPSVSSATRPQLLPSAMPSTAGRSPSKRPSQTRRAPSESSEDDSSARYPTLAARRSLTRLSQSDGKLQGKMPAPINTSLPPKKLSVDSYDAEVSAGAQTDASLRQSEEAFEHRDEAWHPPEPSEPQARLTRKWNFFQRAQASPKSKGKERAKVAVEVPTAAAHQSPYESVTHYAMLDSVEPVGLEEIERIAQENETSNEDSMSESNMSSRMPSYDRRHSSLLPSPPKQEYSRDSDFKARPPPPRIMVREDSSESAEVLLATKVLPQRLPQVVQIQRSPIVPDRDTLQDSQVHPTARHSQVHPTARHAVHTPELAPGQFHSAEIQDTDHSPRQPRLSPVGRIPPVVSRRDRDRKLPDNSFSRPFARTQPRPSVKPPGSLYNQIRELASPVEPGSQPVSSTSTRSDGISGDRKSSANTNPHSVSTNRTSMDVHANHEFFSFPLRKDSDLSYSSSSGSGSLMAAMAAQPLQVEDIWNEYDDLLDEVMPLQAQFPAVTSFGAPFQYSTIPYEQYGQSVPTPFYWAPPPTSELPQPPRSHTVPAVLSVPQQIARFMQPSMSPLLTPQALSDFSGHNGNRNTITSIGSNTTNIPAPSQNGLNHGKRTSIPSARGSMASSRHSRGSGHSRSASLPEVNARNSQSSLTPSARFKRDTQLLDIAEVGNGKASLERLRFCALMTSKWLSFGRVLFSPAHNEMRLGDDPRVLIIDGLGSDWSYYVALSYPTAMVYNLGPEGSSSWPGVDQSPPGNHRHINHTGISAAFPFPKGFFTAVVFRFPLATTDEAYHACIYECKRVLRPGGYLEVAVLDLDLMNMGNQARKAVRDLKTRMQSSDSTISLRNLSDSLVRYIGRRGFEEVQRCIVGVPAAGRIPRSQDMSSTGSGASDKRRSDMEGGTSAEKEFTFDDLLADARDNQTGTGGQTDDSMTRTVAKVGRWWYSTCYEKPVLKTNDSIWNDRALLRECEKQGTSFRLLVCYAQKPTQTRRRTVSV